MKNLSFSRSGPAILRRLFRMGGVLCLVFGFHSLHAVENLVDNGDFEAGSWPGGAYKGEGKLELSHEKTGSGTSFLQIIGLSPEATVQAISKKIAVIPQRQYRLKFQYKLPQGKADVQIRWGNAGYVFSIAKPAPEWTSLDQALSSGAVAGIKYPLSLGDRQERAVANSSVLTIPETVEQIQIYLLIRGEGVFSVDDVELIPVTDGEVKATTSSSSEVSAIQRDEAERLQMIQEAPRAASLQKEDSKKLNLKILEPELVPGTPIDLAAYPRSATNIRIRGEQFTRDQKPVFLFGLESLVVYPWLYKLLGVDFIHTQDASMNGVMQSRKTGETLTVSWARPDWSEVQIQLLLNAGIAPYVQVYEEGKKMPFGSAFPDLFATASHFLKFRFDNPEGEHLREDMWRTVLNVTRSYPVFAYELFNEVLYMDYSPQNLAQFRQAMEGKYETIGRANEAWGTSFASFSAMRPPEKRIAYGGVEMGLTPKGFSRPLWVDWQKYIEVAFGSHVSGLSKFIHSVDPNPNAYCTVQTAANLSQDYAGGPGVYPPAMVKAVDFYSDECGGGGYISQDSGENQVAISHMLQDQMRSALVSYLSEGKPVMDMEVPVAGYNMGRPAGMPGLIPLTSDWKFKEDNEREGQKLGYGNPDFDDSGWKLIQVPGLWGNQGHADCTFGWYRKAVEVPSALQDRKVFLNGSRLADFATIYVNGVLVHKTINWAEKFSLDITPYLRFGKRNLIVVSISNNHRDGGMYWGGIRDFMTLDGQSYNVPAPLRPGQMRSLFWQKIVNGKNGVVPSYAYAAEGTRNSMLNPKRVSMEAIRSLPIIKQEIENVGDIALQEHRKPKRIALNYSFESGRARIYKDADQLMNAPANADLADYYMALLFGGEIPDIVNNEAILKGRCNECRAILFRLGERVLPGVLEKLESFARKGGVVIIDHGSLALDDETHRRIDLSRLAGVAVDRPLTAPRLVKESPPYLDAPVTTVARKADGHTGQSLRLRSASPLAVFEDGSPAVTRNTLGKGAVYYIAAELPYPNLQELLLGILDQNGIQNHEIALERDPAQEGGRFIEARFFSHDGSSLAYVHNWGASCSSKLKILALPEGRYRVRQLRLAQSPIEHLLTRNELRDGMKIEIPSQDPQIFLIENSEAPPRPLPDLGESHRRMLSLIHPSAKSPFRVLINASRAETVTKPMMLTAVNLLEQSGFEVDTNLGALSEKIEVFDGREITPGILKDYQVFATLGSGPGPKKFGDKELEVLWKYVAEGGGLIISANQAVGPNNWLSNRGAKDAVANLFAIKVTDRNISDEKHANGGIPTHPILQAIGGHPITDHVKSIPSRGMSALNISASNAKALVCSSPEATPGGAVAMAALEYGKGRVVVMGDAKWLQPEVLAQGDNARLFLNMIHWLAKKEAPVSPQEIQKRVEYRFDE